MHSLFGDRFLRLFAGDLQRRMKQSTSTIKDQNPEAKAEVAAESGDPDSGDGHEKDSTEGNDLPYEEEQNKKNNTKLKNE